MSNPDPNSQVEILLRQGIDAARAGNNADARALLERVVQQDQRNERAWFWLAAVVDNVEQKRICLGNVLTINPNNTRAKNLIDALQAIAEGRPVPGFTPGETGMGTAATFDAAASQAETFEMPPAMAGPGMPAASTRSGDSNRNVWYIAAAFGAIAVVVLLAVLIVMLTGGDDEGGGSSVPSATFVSLNQPTTAVGQFPTPTTIPLENVTPVTPTPTLPPTIPPPTSTPIPSSTPTSDVPPTLFPSLTGATGKIIMRSGQVPGDENNQPIAIVSPDGMTQQTITGNDRGHTPVLSADGNRMVYIKYSVGQRTYYMQFDNLQGTAPQFGTDFWGNSVVLMDTNYPNWSNNGRWLIFTATGMGSVTDDLYFLDMSDEPLGEVLQRLTSDDGVESWPAFAPDDTQIVYAVDLSSVEFGAGTELRIYNLNDNTARDLTHNRANLIESAPDWSPDGTQIVFAGQESGANESDIYLISASGTTEPQKIVDSEFNDIQPRFSPDGRFIVFSSNRTGNWDVFIYEIATQNYYQVTTAKHTDIANDWGR